MGIKNLISLLESEAPKSIKEVNINSISPNIIVIDASMQLYQFLIQIRMQSSSLQLMNDKGEITSHLQGLLSRTIGLLEKGIRPIYVFDGKSPEMKYEELSRRRKLKEKVDEDLLYANNKLRDASGDSDKEEAREEINKLSKRSVRVTKKDNEEAKYLLRLMGVPVVEAPSEAEAQCVELVRCGKAFAVATEDMDALTFGAPVLLKRLTDSKYPTTQIEINKVLEELDITYDQFVDLCILCGCDYCETIPGIGPKTAIKLIRKHGNIEEIVSNIKNKVPDDYLEKIPKVRLLFKKPVVIPGNNFDTKFKKPDTKGLVEFLVDQKGFNIDRVEKYIKRLTVAESKTVQPKIISFFGPKKL